MGDAPAIDLRNHSMFSALLGSNVVPPPYQRNRIRHRVMRRQLNNTHLCDHHVRLRTEQELLAWRQEHYSSFADVGGIECPLLLTPSPRIYVRGQKLPSPTVASTAVPDILTLSWKDQTVPERTPYIDADSESEIETIIEWESVSPNCRESSKSSPTRSLHSRSVDRPEIHKAVTWTTNGQSTDKDKHLLLSPAYQRHLQKRQGEKVKPSFDHYAIGCLPRRPSISEGTAMSEVGLRLKMLGREGTMPLDRPRSELFPVTSALRRYGTGPEQIRWRALKSGELKVNKVWSRDLGGYSDPHPIQMAREDTQHLIFEKPSNWQIFS